MLHLLLGSVHRKTANQIIYQLKACDNALCSLVRNVWRRRRKLQTGSSFYGVKVNQSNKDECGSFPSHSMIHEEENYDSRT
ncbi:hypothetical protein LDENG_00195480 [Lucifuga dentata]|nr:hypothetical protein LDENG_00195480 [Lucifuga dentata]